MPHHILLHWLNAYGYYALFGSMVFGIIGLPVPDETLLTLSGYLVLKGEFSFLPAYASALLGSATGITVSYLIGRSGGVRIVSRYGRHVHLTVERLNLVNSWFTRVGKWALTIGYFVPGVRHLTALTAGTSKVQYRVFALFAYSGAVLWSLTFISLGYFLGQAGADAVNSHDRWLIALLALLIFALIMTFWWIKTRLVKSPTMRSKEVL
jgi:membrane protein DedA with SNARE-associated domain